MSDDTRPPTLARRTKDDLLGQRIIMLDTALDDEIGAMLCAQIVTLSAEDPTTDIAFWINSPGGSVSAMLAIQDTMDLVPNDVVTVALGMAYSAGQFILTGGTPGRRYALPHAQVLLHQGSAGIGGSAPDIELQADVLRRTRDTVLAITAERTGQAIERIFEDSLRDHTYSATEALEYGFVDHVVDDIAAIRPSARRSTAGLAR